MANQVVDRRGAIIGSIVSVFVGRYLYGSAFVSVEYPPESQGRLDLAVKICKRAELENPEVGTVVDIKLWMEGDIASHLQYKDQHYEIEVDPGTGAVKLQSERLVYS